MSRRLLFALPLLLAGCLSDGVADSTVCVAGAVVDGSVRDLEGIRRIKFPVFSKARKH